MVFRITIDVLLSFGPFRLLAHHVSGSNCVGTCKIVIFLITAKRGVEIVLWTQVQCFEILLKTDVHDDSKCLRNPVDHVTCTQTRLASLIRLMDAARAEER
jgi:hypothetical protein